MATFSQRQALSIALAVCLLGVAVRTVTSQAAAAARAGGAVAAAGVIPPASLGAGCQSSVSVSPWDTGNNFPNVVVCCGGSIDFQWSGNSGVWQIASATCPATFTNSTTARQLLPTTQGSGGVKSLYLPAPGTFYFTSPVGTNCAGGLLFRVQVPPGSGSVCPAGAPVPGPTVSNTAPVQTSTGPGSQAAAAGAPSERSTSAGPGSAAAALGPNPVTQTAPGMSYSQAGNGRKLLNGVQF